MSEQKKVENAVDEFGNPSISKEAALIFKAIIQNFSYRLGLSNTASAGVLFENLDLFSHLYIDLTLRAIEVKRTAKIVNLEEKDFFEGIDHVVYKDVEKKELRHEKFVDFVNYFFDQVSSADFGEVLLQVIAPILDLFYHKNILIEKTTAYYGMNCYESTMAMLLIAKRYYPEIQIQSMSINGNPIEAISSPEAFISSLSNCLVRHTFFAFRDIDNEAYFFHFNKRKCVKIDDYLEQVNSNSKSPNYRENSRHFYFKKKRLARFLRETSNAE